MIFAALREILTYYEPGHGFAGKCQNFGALNIFFSVRANNSECRINFPFVR